MNPAAARDLAVAAHAGHAGPDGEPLVRHLERVAGAVPPEAQATAWLHELAERGAPAVHDLLTGGLTAEELAALELLTRTESEHPALHLRRIVRARGPGGALARAVLLADLVDQLRRLPAASPGARRCRAAQQQLERAQRRAGRTGAERVAAAAA